MRANWLVLAWLLAPAAASAVTSSRSVPSAFGGNGHNVSFDGRLYLVRDGFGWQAMVLRPEAITYLPDGLPDALGPMWSERALLLGPGSITENALTLCQPDAAVAPYACDAAGNPGGAFDCYDLWIIDSDAVTPPAMGGFVMRRRHLLLWVENPRTAGARVANWSWGSIEPLSSLLMGIEPTVTLDGKLMVWQGAPANNGDIDLLMYSVNATPCAAAGWSAPRSISEMVIDPAVMGTYRLADRTLRAADGTTFSPGDVVHGAYPWVMPNGDAIVFTGAPMPCRAVEDPPGCGPRRNALSVLGYPTNWGVAHIDGDVNPSTADTVRLFFSSPGPATFPGLPVTSGADVWPFFGTNTSNYVELIFDDGLDGNYAGFWHMNENVTWAGELDGGRTPDVSGYFNTGVLHGGMGFAQVNDGVAGKALAFDGVDDRIEVANAASLSPVNGITIDLWLRGQNPDCDANPNYRLLLGKGDIGDGSYTIIYEENGALHARVNVGGVQQELWGPAVPFDTWTRVSFEYDGPSGEAAWFYGGAEVARATLASGQIVGTGDPLLVGGPGPRAACPDGDGAFPGRIDELSISRVARTIGTPPPPPDAGVPGDPDAAVPGDEPDASAGGTPDGGPGATGDTTGGCGCRAGGRAGSVPVALLVALLAALAIAAARTAARARRRRCS